ncbi:hypothetical protein F6455_10505 [Proteobacteria bacterium 005FR1]|nr:hypothetical protein [Proteobacteria bacterium 005FR1]
MKDLYRRNKLRPRESNRVKINNSRGSEGDKEAAFTILLNAERKTHYDRVHAVLTQVGYVRRHLGLAGKSEWRSNYGDFLSPHEVPAVRPARKARFTRLIRMPRLALPRLPWAALLTWSLVLVAVTGMLSLTWIAFSNQPLALRLQEDSRQNAVTMHTLSPLVPVYAAPDTGAAQIAELPEFFELSMDPQQSGPRWARVWLDDDRSGWIARNELAAGRAEAAQLEKCRQYGLWRPHTGQHLASGKTGAHRLVVGNPLAKDALVKLKDHEGRTQVFFYVRGGEIARVNSIPEGRFQIHYALGADFSPACGRFLERMEAVQEARFTTFSSGTGESGPPAVARTLNPDAERVKTIPNQSF